MNPEKYYLEYINDYSPEPFSLVDGANKYLGEYGDYEWEEFYLGATDIHTGGEFSLLFNHPVEIADKTKISIVGSEGKVPVIINSYDNEVTIFPNKLKENSSYTLRIGQGALTGYFGMQLSQEILINFKTFVPPVDRVTVEVDTSLAPDKYVLNASARDGLNAQYKFLINENGSWKTLQDYNLNYSFVWKPTSPGGYSFKVMARSEGRTNPFDVEREFFVQVIDNKAPVVTLLKQDITSITNKNISLLLESSDNFSVKRIKLPNGEYVLDSKAAYQVFENGLYEFVVEDTSGNTTPASIRVTNIDKRGPEIMLTPNIQSKTRSNISISITSSDENGVKQIILPNNTVILGNKATFTVIKNGTYHFQVEDRAGNISKKSITVGNIDKELPKISLLPSVTTPTRGTIKIAVSTSDNIKVKRIKLPNGSYVNAPTRYFLSPTTEPTPL
ncbi:triple tyrosine motif-containing protein [Mesobacillus jeotgali]|uniref:Triple tyrosine motif-containing protein n=1 Tax=Mesobacillus jeotgali TaxID=129985 RepID=A0ABY9VHR2_9BACI|nr:triple tyrosine motif-containing protein [Mesobacillus jeotgali]WNF22679.1 triple tyrosine motif-containing protein [Mesobacillus jeotgali]